MNTRQFIQQQMYSRCSGIAIAKTVLLSLSMIFAWFIIGFKLVVKYVLGWPLIDFSDFRGTVTTLLLILSIAIAIYKIYKFIISYRKMKEIC